ncbi:MAG: DUF2269 domain-containing protein [Alphaproteobacteria bacterium]|nr:DUF2269 domain-containing protein [Alphaproteobacteria bacterium]
MEWVELLRWLHIIGASVLLGTGAGIAFFMLMAHRTNDARIIAHTASTVVIADWVFTSSAVFLQPITGALLATAVGWDWSEGWIVLSLILYVVTGAFWIPVVVIQQKLRDLAVTAMQSGEPLPARYYSLFRIWFVCGFPAFAAVLTILWLMIARPQISF